MSSLDVSFESLEVGERFASGGRTVTEADVASFASLTGDNHPQHTDAEWARSSRFGERIAHGMLVISYAAGLVPFDPERVVALRRVRDVTFKAPVKIGDTIRVEGRVEELRELDPEHGLVTFRWRVVNQRGRQVARAMVDAIWRREADVASEEKSDESATREPVLI
jgi:3-hydroxybutyryl-CoA dehydratase